MEASFKKASDRVAALFSRRPEDNEAHSLVVPEPALPRDWPEKLPFRKRPKPYTRSIAWTPTGGEDRTAPDRPYELFVAQGVLAEVRQHLITATSGEPFGFLIGQVVYCPWAEAPYIVIDSLRRETQDLPPADDMDRFRHAWVAASRDARHRRGEVLGWYHRHGVLGLRLSEWDLHLQEEFFPEPWHCALVVASTRRGIIGGFIQRSRRARLFRKGLAPFHEMVELDAKRVDGLRPSVVDWENYSAGETVSVIRAKWPGAKSRQQNWKSEQHGKGVALPTRPESVAPAGKPRGRGGFAGRSWRQAPPDKPTKKKPAAAAEITEDDFTAAVGPDRDIVFESEFTLDDERAAARSKRKKMPPRGKSESKTGKAASGTSTSGASKLQKKSDPEEPPAGEAGEGETADIQEAWYSSDFLDAVWGPPPFDPEVEESRVTEDEAEAEDAEKPVTDSQGRPRFELVPTHEPEPPETDEPGSMDWLLSLIGDTLAARPSADEPATDVEPTLLPDATGEVAPTTDRTERRLPMPSADKRTRRPTYVTSSHHPDSDPEAPIPVVFLASAEKWRPSNRQKQVAGTLLAVLVAALLWQTFFSGGGPAQPPGSAQGPIVAPAPSPEFVTLADDFLTVLQTFREDLVAFRLDRTDCAGLGSNLAALAAARVALADYVAGDPEVADRFSRLDSDFNVAFQHFASTDCPVPPSISTPPGDGS